jgi:hypothetical protein
MSLRIVYSQGFTVQPKYRKKDGITEDERNRNVRRLKMFDRAQPTSDSGEGRVKHDDDDKKDFSDRASQQALTDSSGDAPTTDPLPPYSESQDGGPGSPPTYDAARRGQVPAREA